MPYGSTSFCQPLRMVSEDLELREPTPIPVGTNINIGDVGFTRRGQFQLLFSAGSPLGNRQLGEDVPIKFEPLNVGTPALRDPRPPGCLHTPTIRRVGASPDATGRTVR